MESNLFVSAIGSDSNMSQLDLDQEDNKQNNNNQIENKKDADKLEENKEIYNIEESNLSLNNDHDDFKKNTFYNNLEGLSKELQISHDFNKENSDIINNNESNKSEINKTNIIPLQEVKNYKELETKINQLELKISQLEQEKENLKSQNQLFQSQITEFEQKLQVQNSAYPSKINIIENNNEKENEYKSKIENYQKQLTDQESSFKNKLQKMNKDLEEQKSSLKTIQDKNSELENNNLWQKSQLESAEKEKKKLNNEIIYLNNELKNKKKIEDDNNKKISELEQENLKLKTEKIIYQKSLCTTIHNGIKCVNCFKIPIVGYRYECSQCDNYNLCHDCHEKNSETGLHPHFFTRYSNPIDNKNIFSYKCLSTNLKVLIFKGRTNTKIKLELQNDKIKKWPENTKLIWDRINSEIQTDDVQLKGLRPSEKGEFIIHFKNLQNLEVKEYKVGFDFNINGKNYGDKLWIFIVVKDGQQILNNFKAKYKTVEDYSDDVIYEVLAEKNCDFEKALFKLYFK